MGGLLQLLLKRKETKATGDIVKTDLTLQRVEIESGGFAPHLIRKLHQSLQWKHINYVVNIPKVWEGGYIKMH